MLFDSPIAAALNHLLEAEPWARARLAPFAGDAVELCLPLLPALRFVIEPGGRVAPAVGTETALRVRLRPEGMAALARGGTQNAAEAPPGVDVSGDARLAAEILALLRYLRWDVEEDLSHLIGDVAAHRLVGTGRDFLAWQGDAARRLAGSLGDYASEEKRWLVQRSDLRAFASRLGTLGAQLEALENRVRRLG